MSVWLNAIGYQAVWFCAVIGAGRGQVWPGVLAALVFIAWQLALSPHRGADLRLLAVALLLGCLIDGRLAWSGWVRYAGDWPSPRFAPVWILAVWASFAMTLTHSMAFLLPRAWLALMLGAIGGPLAYLGAASGWQAVAFAGPVMDTALVLAVAWAIALPLLALLARRWCRTSTSEVRTRARPA